MMGLHQNYPVTWGTERMEGLTLDLGLDGMFSPLPTESNPVFVTKDSDPSSHWRGFLESSQTEQHMIADINLDDDDSDDPCALLLNGSNCVGGSERKPDMFELSLSYPPPLARQQLINMKGEREDVQPSLTMGMRSLPEMDATSQSEGSFNCWQNTALERPRKELHLYGTVGDEISEVEFLDDDTMDDCPEIKLDRCASSSVLLVSALQQRRMYPETIILDDDLPEIKPDRRGSHSVLSGAAVQQQPKMYPETIILDDDTDDDLVIVEERCTAEKKDGSVSKSDVGGDTSRRGSEERGGFVVVSQAMPLRQIKQHVRSTRTDEDYNSPATPSASPEITTGQQDYGAKELDIWEKNYHRRAGEQVKQDLPNSPICEKNYHNRAGEQVKQNLPNSPNSKRVRGHDDHDWLPSDLLDASDSERRNEAKRVRVNGNGEHDNDVPEAAHRIPTDVPVPPSVESGVQVQKHNPLIDVNQAIQAMPQETAEAFKELIRLVGPFEARAFRAGDDLKNRRPLTNDSPPPPPSPPVTTTGSQQSSRPIDEMESRSSMASDLHGHTPYTPPLPATENQASRIVDEMENWRPLASDVQDDPLPSQNSATTSDFELNDSPTLSTSDFELNDSPLATVNQPIFPQGGTPPCIPSESTFSESSPHLVAIYEQQNAGKRTSNADVVLYEPKQEPVESMEMNMSGSVVHVKEEPDLHYEPAPDPISVRPVQENTTMTPCYSNRKLIVTALNTFEAVRRQIIKDPSYGQPVVEPQTPGMEVNTRRLRADLKAASLMRSKGFWLNEQIRPIGDVPGVAVGDCFRYRIEMAVIGLHRAVQAGIAIVPEKYSPYGEKVACSVVLGVSDPYHDDNDMGDKVIYSGQGGLCGRTKQAQDQELTRGNLALSNSYKWKLPVRLIRGHKEQTSMTGILYSYDGLYQIVNMKYQKGVNGKMVYKFFMERLPGQPPIFSGYPTPLESQSPAREPAQNEVHWTESADTKPLYLEKRPVA